MARLGYERPLFSHFFWKGAWGAARRTARRTAEWRCRVPCRVPPGCPPHCPPHRRVALPRALPRAAYPQAPFPRAVRGSALYTEPQDPRGLPRSAVNFAWPGGQAILAKAPCFGVPRPPSGGRGRATTQPLSLWVRLFLVEPVAEALPALLGRRVRGAISPPCASRARTAGHLIWGLGR